MCGIVGIISNKGYANVNERKKLFQQMLFVDALRGEHSTGMFLVDKKGVEVDYVKRAMHATDFLELPAVNKLINDLGSRTFVVGHNRFATQGKINNINAHPFVHGKITGVHNGGVQKSSLDKGHNFEVDSDALIYNLATRGVEETLAKVEGAFCLVWHDAGDKCLHIIRNNHRPMAFAFDDKGNQVYFASESGMLKFLLDRNNIDYDRIEEAEVGIEYIFSADNPTQPQTIRRELYRPKVTYVGSYIPRNWKDKLNQTATSDKSISRQEAHSRKLHGFGLRVGDRIRFYTCEFNRYSAGTEKGWIEGVAEFDPYPRVLVHSFSDRNWHKYEDCLVEGTVVGVNDTNPDDVALLVRSDSLIVQTRFKKAEQESEEKSAKILRLPDRSKEEKEEEKSYEGPNRKLYTEKEFRALIQSGCIDCSQPLTFRDAASMGWTTGGDPLCPDCRDRHRSAGSMGIH